MILKGFLQRFGQGALKCRGIKKALIITATIVLLLIYSDKRPSVPPAQMLPMTTSMHGEHQEPSSVTINDPLSSIHERFMDRKLTMERVCSEAKDRTSRACLITGYRPANLSVCIVHKAASTVWLRLLMLLRGKGKDSAYILSNKKWRVHHEYSRQFARFNIYKGGQKRPVWRTTRVLTARDPYARLWSAYVDKFLYPMFYDIGITIVKRHRPRASLRDKTCGHDVTFAEFIKYVIAEGHNRGKYSDHWLPVSDICDPCKYKPDFIAKQETLSTDIQAMMEHLGLSDTTRDLFSSDQDDTTTTDELDVHLRGITNVKRCMTKTEYLRRIWIGLAVNGHLHPGEDLQHTFENMPLNFTQVFDLIVNLRQLYGVDKVTREYVRKRALVQAYKRVPRKDLDSLQRLYKLDFQMFGYNNTPPTDII